MDVMADSEREEREAYHPDAGSWRHRRAKKALLEHRDLGGLESREDRRARCQPQPIRRFTGERRDQRGIGRESDPQQRPIRRLGCDLGHRSRHLVPRAPVARHPTQRDVPRMDEVEGAMAAALVKLQPQHTEVVTIRILPQVRSVVVVATKYQTTTGRLVRRGSITLDRDALKSKNNADRLRQLVVF